MTLTLLKLQCLQDLGPLNLDELQPPSAPRLDGDSGLAAGEVLGDQANQLRVGLAIHRQRLDLREPLARLLLVQLAYAGIWFDFDFDDQWFF